MTQAAQQTQASKIGKVLLQDVRLAFAHGLFRASSVTDPTTGRQSAPAYSVSLLFPRDHKCVPLVGKAMQEVAFAKWGPDGAKVLAGLIAGQRICMRNGDSKPDLAGYPGNLFISTRSTTQPKFVNHVPLEITAAEASATGKFYSGAYVNASISIWAQSNQHGKRINAQILAVQFVRDGEPLAGGSTGSAEDFGAVEASAQAGAEFGAMFGGGAPAQAPAANDFGNLLGSL